MIAPATHTQPTYAELLHEIKTLQKRDAMREKRGREHVALIERFYFYLDCVRKVDMTRYALLDGGDKTTCRTIIDMCMLRKEYERRNGFTRIPVADIEEFNGDLSRTEDSVKTLFAMGLFEWANANEQGVYWIKVPDDFTRRLSNPPANFKRRKTGSMVCSECGRKCVCTAYDVLFRVWVCPSGHEVRSEIITRRLYKGKPIDKPIIKYNWTDEEWSILSNLLAKRGIRLRERGDEG